MATRKKTKAARVVGVGDQVIVRSYGAGVHYGTVARISPDATRVDLTSARHCWSWSGDRLTADDIARVGAKSGDRWSGVNEATTLADVCSIHLVTAEARASLDAAPVSVRG